MQYLLKPKTGLIKKVRRKGLTYLEVNALLDLQDSVEYADANNIDGIICECGVALGGSSIILANAKNQSRSLELYDSFETMPPPTEKDGVDAHQRFETIKDGKSTGLKGELYYGYEKDLLSKVKENIRSLVPTEKNKNIKYFKGFYEDSLKINEPVALAHIDCDWYSSVWTCLKEIEPHLSTGGVLIIDDYYHYSGCKKAVDDYFKDKSGYEFKNKTRLQIHKV